MMDLLWIGNVIIQQFQFAHNCWLPLMAVHRGVELDPKFVLDEEWGEAIVLLLDLGPDCARGGTSAHGATGYSAEVCALLMGEAKAVLGDGDSVFDCGLEPGVGANRAEVNSADGREHLTMHNA
jgi:hypothetical protein